MKKVALSPKRFSLRTSARIEMDNSSPKHLKIRNVLVPTDFSPASLEAVEFTLPMLKQFGARLHLVHVVAPDYPLATIAAMPLMVSEPDVRRNVQRHLCDVARNYGMSLSPESIHSSKGQAFEEICRLARKLDIDLIVISTRGNTGLKHLLLGSTAERVVRYSPCPVLVMRGAAKKAKLIGNGKPASLAFGFRKILVPIDFSECSMQGLAYAKILAEEFGSTLVLLHSLHVEYYVSSDEYARYDLPLLMAQAEKAAKTQMRELVQQTKQQGFKVESAMEIGHPGDQICDRALDRHADLIVTSTHGLTGLKHVLIGSTAEFVVRHAPCPVLVVPSHERSALNSTNR